MTNSSAVIPNVDDDSRWQGWRARGAASDRRTATNMRNLMFVIVAALSVWFVVQLA